MTLELLCPIQLLLLDILIKKEKQKQNKIIDKNNLTNENPKRPIYAK